MPELSDAEREELARLRERFGDVDLEGRTEITGEFGPIDPMLAERLEGPLAAVDEGDWFAEQKYDGTRLIVEKFDDSVRAYTRRGIDRYGDIPPVHADFASLPNDLVLDGELTYLTPSGTSTFRPIHTSEDELAAADLTPVYFVFDVLFDGEDLCDRPLHDRKECLESAVNEGDHLQITEDRRSDFPGFFEDLTDAGEEGIILKRRASHYYPGVRSEQWLKVKQFTERDAIVVGYTEGRGSRAETFGSLVLSDGEGYIGRVGTGFSEDELEELTARMTPTDERSISPEVVGEDYTPVEPFVVAVKYQEITDGGKLRSPVYLGLNTEKPMKDVRTVE